MKITYDSEANAMYIELSPAEVCGAELVAVDGNISADVDAEGNVVGVEIIGVDSALRALEAADGLRIPATFPIPARSKPA